MKDSSSKVFSLLKSALEASEEKGKFIEHLKLSEYFNFESGISFFIDKVDGLSDSISRTCQLILKEIENENVD